MEYIKAEEFLKQDKEVQKEFINWWQPSVGDLFQNNLIGGIGVITDVRQTNEGIIPLLTEGQIRKFIEDKTKNIIMIQYDFLDNTYELYLSSAINDYEDYGWFHNLGTNLLQAYWKVAIKIAKEGI